MLGLSVANILGVPLATWTGQKLGWSTAFMLVGAIAFLTAGLARLCLMPMPAHELASPLRELAGLRRAQLWLTLGITAVGFGGLFAVYSYIAPTLTQVTGVGEAAVPLYLALIGTGMVCGSLFGGWLADHGLLRAIGLMLYRWTWPCWPCFRWPHHRRGSWQLTCSCWGSLPWPWRLRCKRGSWTLPGMPKHLRHRSTTVPSTSPMRSAPGLAVPVFRLVLAGQVTGPLGAGLAAGGFLILLASGYAAGRSKTTAQAAL